MDSILNTMERVTNTLLLVFGLSSCSGLLSDGLGLDQSIPGANNSVVARNPIPARPYTRGVDPALGQATIWNMYRTSGTCARRYRQTIKSNALIG